MRLHRLLAVLPLLPLLARAQLTPIPAPSAREFEFSGEFAPAGESGEPADDGSRRVALSELVRIAPGEADAACAGLVIAAEGPLARAGGADCEQGVLSLRPGRWRITAAEPPPEPLAGRYRRLDVAFTVEPLPGAPPWAPVAPSRIDDRSEFRDGGRSFCVRLAEVGDGPSISGLRVRFHQRFRAVAEGLSDERGRFCADDLGAWPLTVSVNGGEDFRDAAVSFPSGAERGEIALAREERVSCRLVDPGGYLRLHPAARFAIRTAAARTDTALTPGTPVAWNPWGERRRDAVSFGVLSGDLPPDDGGAWPPAPRAAGPETPAGSRTEGAGDEAEAPPPSPLDDEEGVTLYLVEAESAAPLVRFTLSPRAFRRACTLVMPSPERRALRVSLECPAGAYLWPALRVGMFAEQPPAAPGEAASLVVAVSDDAPPEITRARRVPLALDAAGDYRLFPPPCAAREGCLSAPVPVRPDERGGVRVSLPAGHCVSREQAIAMSDRLLAAKSAPPAPAPEAPAGEDREDCLGALPLTALEREALQRETGGLSCPALFELNRLESGDGGDAESVIVD